MQRSNRCREHRFSDDASDISYPGIQTAVLRQSAIRFSVTLEDYQVLCYPRRVMQNSDDTWCEMVKTREKGEKKHCCDKLCKATWREMLKKITPAYLWKQ